LNEFREKKHRLILVKVKVNIIDIYYFGINSREIYFQVRDLWSIQEQSNGWISVENDIKVPRVHFVPPSASI